MAFLRRNQCSLAMDVNQMIKVKIVVGHWELTSKAWQDSVASLVKMCKGPWML